MAEKTYEGEWTYQNWPFTYTKTGYRLRSGTSVLIRTDLGYSTLQYRKLFTHEFGHAFGWFDHSPVVTDVMYQGSTTSDILTSRDKNHLLQIY